jgi:hypothetical protein
MAHMDLNFTISKVNGNAIWAMPVTHTSADICCLGQILQTSIPGIPLTFEQFGQKFFCQIVWKFVQKFI